MRIEIEPQVKDAGFRIEDEPQIKFESEPQVKEAAAA
ncbi:hypothetical protein IW245_004031 [Longispora fulva]|uniref:Uncharacterized protein n=1 Tax=Longispora fulva TaxID=619741 RepID=A0A8J7KXH3_9ACTN|nr:hypothetical protein [Longispora fulva]